MARTGTDEKGHYDALAFSAPNKQPISEDIEPIISVKEARKMLGLSVKDTTDGELRELLLQQEQIIRFIFRKYRVHKDAMVK